jgi:hypothetical protein
MDEGRYYDLRNLQAVIDSRLKPHDVRRAAYKSKVLILRQVNDKGLTRLRERLIKAAKAGDEKEEWKISNQIKDYLHEKKLDKPV